MKSTHIDTEGLRESVERRDNTVKVKARRGYAQPGRTMCTLKDTGNGYIAHFHSASSCQQDSFVCMDYSDARHLILALSAFKSDLGFSS